jgi:sn-glycerol 3-phosphate transport system permease protein
VPDELLEAACMWTKRQTVTFSGTLLPLSKTSMAALFVISSSTAGTEYLWPLATTSEDTRMYPVVIIKRMIAGGDSQNRWNGRSHTALLAMLPPTLQS